MTNYKYPEVKAGTEWSADFLLELTPLWVIKDNHTDTSSDTTFTDDPEFRIEDLKANGIYMVDFAIKFSGDNDGDIKTNWTLPSGATGNRLCIGPGSTANASGADNINMRMGVHGPTTSVHYSATRDNISNQVWCWERAVVVMGTVDGWVTLSWAQAASSVSASRVAAEGWGIAERIA